MNQYFTDADLIILLRLCIAHIVTDFLLQTQRGIANKQSKLLKGYAFWMHGLYTCAGVILATSNTFNWGALALIVTSHLVIDYLKLVLCAKPARNWPNRDMWLFITDQLLHILMLIVGWLIIIHGFGKMNAAIEQSVAGYELLVRVLGYLVVIGPVTYLVKYLTIRWAQEVTETNYSLADAGKWIGILERSMVISFVYMEQFTAIGFLVAAKSILRLIDKPDIAASAQEQKSFSARKHTEYVLIGTFLSFGSALFTGLFINWILKS